MQLRRLKRVTSSNSIPIKFWNNCNKLVLQNDTEYDSTTIEYFRKYMLKTIVEHDNKGTKELTSKINCKLNLSPGYQFNENLKDNIIKLYAIERTPLEPRLKLFTCAAISTRPFCFKVKSIASC